MRIPRKLKKKRKILTRKILTTIEELRNKAETLATDTFLNSLIDKWYDPKFDSNCSFTIEEINIKDLLESNSVN